MTTFLDHLPHSAPTFEDTEHKRIDLINSIEETQLRPDGLLRRVRAAYLSRKALKLAQREQVYLPQKEDLIQRAVVLNPGLEEKAHQTLDQVYDEEHPELAQPYSELLPAKQVAHFALKKSVELSHDLHHDDDAPTNPIPVSEILAATLEAVSNEQTQQIPVSSKSTAAQEQSWRHFGRYQQDQKAERVEKASEAELSEVDDAVRVDPHDLFDDDDEDDKAA